MPSLTLILGPTGNIGTPLVARLARENAFFRIAVRDPKKKTASLGANGAAVRFDFADPSTYAPALDGVERLFLLTPFVENMVELTGKAVDAAKRAGVRHVVKLSALGAGEEAMLLGRLHREAERLVEASGMAWTHVRPNGFLQNFVAFYAGSVKAQGKIFAPQGEGRVSSVDARDVAAVAARALTGSGHERRAYDVTGPAAHSLSDLARELSRVAGKPVAYVPIPESAAREAMLGRGMPAWNTDAILDLFRLYREGGAARVTRAVEEVTGAPGRSMEAYIDENRAAFV